jgi:hypothetical protein
MLFVARTHQREASVRIWHMILQVVLFLLRQDNHLHVPSVSSEVTTACSRVGYWEVCVLRVAQAWLYSQQQSSQPHIFPCQSILSFRQ